MTKHITPIETLDPAEVARLLRAGKLLLHGHGIPLREGSSRGSHQDQHCGETPNSE
jgi:hypothetical protein